MCECERDGAEWGDGRRKRDGRDEGERKQVRERERIMNSRYKANAGIIKIADARSNESERERNSQTK